MKSGTNKIQVGELVLYSPSYDKTRKVLGMVIEIFNDKEYRNRKLYKVEWFEDIEKNYRSLPDSVEDSTSIHSFRKCFARWKEKNVEPIQEET